MPATQPSRELFPLCYEHHVKMKATDPETESRGTGTVTFGCTTSDCSVLYNASVGYFLLGGPNAKEMEIVPNVMCSRDGAPMYLAEIDLKKSNFRLWRCPQCNATRTNEEGLVGGK